MRTLLPDLFYCVRSLRKTRGFTWAAILTLALGIAANTVVFSVFNATLLRPLPYPEADRLMMLHWLESGGRSQGDISAQAFFHLKEHASSLDIAAIYPFNNGVNLASAGPPQYVKALQVSPEFFRILKAPLLIGRNFSPGGDPHAVILSYGLWEQNFGKDPSVLNRAIRINGENYAVAGVMPPGFRSFPDAALWLPLQLGPGAADSGNEYRVIARLRAGSTQRQAKYELESLPRIDSPVSRSAGQTRQQVLTVQPFRDALTGDVREGLTILFGSVLFVLTITCTNLAVLLIVRKMSRRHEIAIRIALGSSRGRVLRILFLESWLLVVAGGILGGILAKESLPFILTWAPAELPSRNSIHIDGAVLLFVLSVSAATCIFFGLAPALSVFRIDTSRMLGQSPRTSTPGAEHTRTGHILVAAQTALTLILLTGATLFLRSLWQLERVPTGFDLNHATVAQISLSADRYKTTVPTAQMLDKVCERIQGLPGVKAAAISHGLPLEKAFNLPLYPEDAPDKIEHAAEYRIVSAQYFRAMGMEMVSGRYFTSADGAGAAPVAIVNETLARRWWPAAPAIGHSVNVGKELSPQGERSPQFADQPREIVGVAADVHEKTLGEPAPPTVFIPAGQAPDKTTEFVNKVFLTSIIVRAENPAEAASIRGALNAADPDLSLASLQPLKQVVAGSLADHGFYALLIASFGGFALLLTAIGLYGLLSYQVRIRLREIALRIAVGAQPSQILFLIFRRGARLVFAGLLAGAVASGFVAHTLRSLLYNTKDLNPSGLIAATALVGLVALTASLLIALQAASIEPMAILRNE